MGNDPYKEYEKDLIQFETRRPLYKHQFLMTSHGITYNHMIWAAEMGTGKSLAFIELMDYAYNILRFVKSNDDVWYIGPKAGVAAVGRELLKWDSKIRPRMFTYNKSVSKIKEWVCGNAAPKIGCFDESSKIKTPTAQRSQAALHLADAIRHEYGRDGFIIEMSGSPAPKDPTDWWHQCEVACPGFLKEGNIHLFKKRLSVVEERESINGGVYPHLVTWLDDPRKCAVCGLTKEEGNHESAFEVIQDDPSHPFQKSIDEVSLLYKRMKGLVLVLKKKDTDMNLPDKIYQTVRLKPSVELLRAAKLLRKTATRAADLLNLSRELSDGFQYKQEDSGELVTCPLCFGNKTIMEPNQEELPWDTPTAQVDGDGSKEEITCPTCGGEGTVSQIKRVTYEVGSVKDEFFIDELDEHESIGRYIVWGGFQGTVDRLARIAKQQGWAILKIDGRKWVAEKADGTPDDLDKYLSAMDRSDKNFKQLQEEIPRLCVIGAPDAGGMALTFTASPTMLYFSNSFKGEARIQSEDRGHRIGMDENRGLTIKDIFLLPCDEYVYDNIQRKIELQNLTLGEIKSNIEELEKEYEATLISDPKK